MSVNETTVDAPPQAVWDVLADPPSYEEWVVGNKVIRDYDRELARPGHGVPPQGRLRARHGQGQDGGPRG